MKRTAVVESERWHTNVSHRCSQIRCPNPAIACHSEGYRRKNSWAHRRRYWCEAHLDGIHRFVRSGRVWFRVGPDEWLANLAHPWPPPMYTNVPNVGTER